MFAKVWCIWCVWYVHGVCCGNMLTVAAELVKTIGPGTWPWNHWPCRLTWLKIVQVLILISWPGIQDDSEGLASILVVQPLSPYKRPGMFVEEARCPIGAVTWLKVETRIRSWSWLLFAIHWSMYLRPVLKSQPQSRLPTVAQVTSVWLHCIRKFRPTCGGAKTYILIFSQTISDFQVGTWFHIPLNGLLITHWGDHHRR